MTHRLERLRAQGWTLPAELEVALDRPKRAEHGDLATNVALALQKVTGRKPRELADALTAELRKDIDAGAGA